MPPCAANLRAGDLDLTEGIAASDVKTVEADSKLALAKVTGLGYQGITFNINNGKVPANDPFRTPACVKRSLRPLTAMRSIRWSLRGCIRLPTSRFRR